MNLSFDVLEDVVVINRLIHGPNQVLQRVYLLGNLVELMSEVNVLTNREVHLLDGVEALEDFAVLMSPVNLINRIVQRLQVSQLFLNLRINLVN